MKQSIRLSLSIWALLTISSILTCHANEDSERPHSTLKERYVIASSSDTARSPAPIAFSIHPLSRGHNEGGMIRRRIRKAASPRYDGRELPDEAIVEADDVEKKRNIDFNGQVGLPGLLGVQNRVHLGPDGLNIHAGINDGEDTPIGFRKKIMFHPLIPPPIDRIRLSINTADDDNDDDNCLFGRCRTRTDGKRPDVSNLIPNPDSMPFSDERWDLKAKKIIQDMDSGRIDGSRLDGINGNTPEGTFRIKIMKMHGMQMHHQGEPYRSSGGMGGSGGVGGNSGMEGTRGQSGQSASPSASHSTENYKSLSNSGTNVVQYHQSSDRVKSNDESHQYKESDEPNRDTKKPNNSNATPPANDKPKPTLYGNASNSSEGMHESEKVRPSNGPNISPSLNKVNNTDDAHHPSNATITTDKGVASTFNQSNDSSKHITDTLNKDHSSNLDRVGAEHGSRIGENGGGSNNHTNNGTPTNDTKKPQCYKESDKKWYDCDSIKDKFVNGKKQCWSSNDLSWRDC